MAKPPRSPKDEGEQKHSEHEQRKSCCCSDLDQDLKHLTLAIHQLTKTVMIAQASLDASLASLTTAVNNAAAALASSSTATSTPDTVVAAYQAGVDAQTVALAAATPPAATPPPVP
jgi:hypothetical protein